MIKYFLPLFFPFFLFADLYTYEEYKKQRKEFAKLSVQAKKERFYKLVVPAVLEVDKELLKLYYQTKKAIQNKEDITSLMQEYHAKTPQDLLKRIKPHPPSITIAQAALESAWGTSRFFLMGNNIFGIWSRSKDPKKTIPAAIRRKKSGKRVYLKKYQTLEEGIRDYYKILATKKAYRRFRNARYITNNPYRIIPYLDKYSEKKKEYPKILRQVIRHNHLLRFDKQRYSIK